MPRKIQATVTERTFYPILMDFIREAGGSGVSEVQHNSVPDIVFRFESLEWILSVKIGEDSKTIKDAFLQYLRHKQESQIPCGIVLFLPETVRNLEPEEKILHSAINTLKVTALVDTDIVREELRDRAFPGVIEMIGQEVARRVAKREKRYFTLPLVIALLQQQVTEMMRDVHLEEQMVLDIIADPVLLRGLGHLKPSESDAVARFLSSFVLMSQILFLRLLYAERPDIFQGLSFQAITHHKLRSAFERVLQINYRPIYSVDVLDAIPDNFVRDTFDLIWGLAIENVRYELPGRIFHELMPKEIRKMLAAFYTRPQAADLLAELTILHSSESVLDLASGSGTILTAAYRRKLALHRSEGKTGNPHKRFCEEEIFGADIMPFAVHLTSANLAAMDAGTTIERTQIMQGDSLKLGPGKVFAAGIQQLGMFHETPMATTTEGDRYLVPLKEVQAALMNPPFTKVERGIKAYVDMERYSERCGAEVGLWGHFIALADIFLMKGGRFGGGNPD